MVRCGLLRIPMGVLPNLGTTNRPGFVISVTAPAPGNYQTLYLYDANGNLREIDRQQGVITSSGGGIQQAPDGWQTTKFTYTAFDRLQSVADELDHAIIYGYDLNGNLVSVTDPNNKVTAFVCDERDLLWKTIDPASPSAPMVLLHDENGNLTSIQDAKGHLSLQAFDDYDRQRTLTYADGTFERFNYDTNGNVVSRRMSSGQTIIYSYDSLNHLT